MNAPTQARLQDLLRRESRSLLQYLDESFPWTTLDKQSALSRLHELAAEEREAAAKVARLLTRRRVALPYLGAFPEEFTTINFIGLDYAVPRLVAYERRAIADLEQDLARLDDEEAKRLVQEVLTLKQGHLKELEGLATGLPAATVR